MNEIQLITLTAFLTAIFGIIGALSGYVIINFVLEPIKELKKEIGLVSNNLVFWAAALSNPGIHEDASMDSSDFRKSSSMIHAKYYVIPKRMIWGRIFSIPDVKNINIACKTLIFLSNIVSTPPDNLDQKSFDHIEQSIGKLKKALNIEADFKE